MITYNHELYIRQAVEGILAQKTNFLFELRIGEDCSNDNTASILKIYSQKFPEIIKVRYNEQNMGMMYNAVNTLNECSGKYIAFCEGDDYWTDPDKLQKQVDFLEANEDFTITFCNVLVQDEQKRNKFIAYQNKQIPDSCIPTIPIPQDVTEITDLAKGNYIHTPGVVFRNVFMNYPLPGYLATGSVGDWPLYMYLARMGKIKFINDIMCVYRVHNHGVFSQKSRTEILFGELMLYPRLFEEKIFKKEIIEIWEEKITRLLYSFLVQDYNSNKDMMAKVLDEYSQKFPILLVGAFHYLNDELSEAKKTQKISDFNDAKIPGLIAFSLIKKIKSLKSYVKDKFYN